jgi:carboxylate-amine ligase
MLPYSELLEELLALVRADADDMGCRAEVEHARTIVRRGTSAHRQLAAYDAARQAGEDHDAALRRVVDHLAGETVADL